MEPDITYEVYEVLGDGEEEFYAGSTDIGNAMYYASQITHSRVYIVSKERIHGQTP